MDKGTQSKPKSTKSPFDTPRWFYAFIVFLVLLSLVTLKNADGKWEVTLGVREITPILAVLALIPTLFVFLRQYDKGKVELPGGIMLSVETIEKKVEETKEEVFKVAQATKEQDPAQIESVQRSADKQLAGLINPDELPIVQRAYIPKLHELVKDFNRNRHQPFTDQRTINGDKIAFEMRTIAPLVSEQFDVKQWLNSANPGKRLAAIKYLDWAQDIEFLEDLLNRLLRERRFTQYHIRLALSSMADQFSMEHHDLLESKFREYNSVSGAKHETWSKRILINIPRE
jgi:hypothetical protein